MVAQDSPRRRRLEGKVAVVTGGGRGIGRAEAILMAAEGARVVVNDIGGQPYGEEGYSGIAEDVVAQIRAAGGQAIAETSSIDSMAGGEAVIARAMEAYGRIDILSNNAGIAIPARVDEMTEEIWDRVVDVSLKGYFATIRAAAPHLIRQGSGCIVNKSSPSGFGHYGMANYSAAKEGVTGLTRTVARDLGEFGVRCNVIRPIAMDAMDRPGIPETLFRSQRAGYAGLWNRWIGAPGPVPAASVHVAALTVWLCSDDTTEVNGREFFIAGTEVGLFPEPELQRIGYAHDGWTLEKLEESANREYLIGDVRNRFARSPAPE